MRAVPGLSGISRDFRGARASARCPLPSRLSTVALRLRHRADRVGAVKRVRSGAQVSRSCPDRAHLNHATHSVRPDRITIPSRATRPRLGDATHSRRRLSSIAAAPSHPSSVTGPRSSRGRSGTSSARRPRGSADRTSSHGNSDAVATRARPCLTRQASAPSRCREDTRSTIRRSSSGSSSTAVETGSRPGRSPSRVSANSGSNPLGASTARRVRCSQGSGFSMAWRRGVIRPKRGRAV